MTAVIFNNRSNPKYVKVRDFEELLENHILEEDFEVTVGKPPPAKRPYFFDRDVAASLRGHKDLLAVVDSHLYEEYEVKRKDEHNQRVIKRFKKIGDRSRRHSV